MIKVQDKRSTTEHTDRVSNVSIVADNYHSSDLQRISFNIKGGEIVGLAGLEGSGQKELLRAIYANRQSNVAHLTTKGRMAYVTGDRKKEGNFHLWSILENMTISKLAFGELFKAISDQSLSQSAQPLYDRLEIRSEGIHSDMVSLSGGNQQKVLIARALMTDADIILLDDPTRGVDIATKTQLYGIFREAAASGKLLLWYSTEDTELEICDRVLVMRYGAIIQELCDAEITKEKINQVAFSGHEWKKSDTLLNRSSKIRLFNSGSLVAFVVMILIYALCVIKSPRLLSLYAVELILSGAIPLILLTFAQMFIVGLSHIDVSIGTYMGLVNVTCATYLYTHPPVGVAMLVVWLLLYIGMGLAIYYRSLSSIIVTIGASFVWGGIALVLLDAPGGKVPEWLKAIFWMDTAVPITLIIIVIVMIVLAVFYSSRYGTALKGFGNNPSAMVRSGWSEPKAYFVTFLVSGLLCTLAGLVFSGIIGAADSNAMGSYTLLTVAAVVLGGCSLSGGIVTVTGTLFGAVTLSMVSILLGFFSISTVFSPAVQGSILILIIAARTVSEKSK
jgi:ribose transport system ATP-binding protein